MKCASAIDLTNVKREPIFVIIDLSYVKIDPLYVKRDLLHIENIIWAATLLKVSIDKRHDS